MTRTSQDRHRVGGGREQAGRTPSRRWTRLLGWALVVTTPVLVFGIVEAAVRLLGVEPSLSRQAAVPAWLDRNILAKESRWIELLSGSPQDLRNYYRTYLWDRYLLYKLRPGLDLPLTDVMAPPEIRARTRWTFHTNARGFNAKEVPYAKPSGIFRIVALGDSSTFGWGVETGSIYPHLLETALRARRPDISIEVVNLGVCGYSSFQGLILLQREAMRYQPDLVTLSYGSNDFSKVPESFEQVYQRNMGWTGAARELLHHSRASGAEPDHGQDVYNVGPQRSRWLLEEMARFAKSHGVDPIFVSNCVPGEMSQPIRAEAVSTGTPLLDTQELLEAAVEDVQAGRRYAEEMASYRALYGPAMLVDYPWLAVYLTDRCHPNRIGHRLIAEALVPMVEGSRAYATVVSGSKR